MIELIRTIILIAIIFYCIAIYLHNINNNDYVNDKDKILYFIGSAIGFAGIFIAILFPIIETIYIIYRVNGLC